MRIEFRSPIVIHKKKKYYIYLLTVYFENIREALAIPFLNPVDAEIEIIKLKLSIRVIDFYHDDKFKVTDQQVDFEPKIGLKTIWGSIR